VAEPTDTGVVTWTEVDGLFCLRLCAPPNNTLGPRLVNRLAAGVDAFARSHARVLTIASSVGGYFAVGAGVQPTAGTQPTAGVQPTADTTEADNHTLELGLTLGRLANGDRPSIAVIDGIALGTGLGLAMACTLRVGSQAAHLGLPEQGFDPISGERALTIGLLDQLVEPGQADDAALELATRLASGPDFALTQILRGLDESTGAHPARYAGTLANGSGVRDRLLAYLQHGPAPTR
jgi:enoyl-CoA hydratase